MFKLISLSLVAAATMAGPALASDRLSDAEFLKAARCSGLMKSANLGAPDGVEIDAFLKAQQRRRPTAILDMADRDKRDARFEAKRANDYTKARLQAEREGPCKVYAAPSMVASAR